MEIDTQFLTLLMGGETVVGAALTVALIFLLTKLRSIEGVSQAYEVVSGRVSELKQTYVYSLFAQTLKVLVDEEADTSPVAKNLKDAAIAYLDSKGWGLDA